MPALRVIPNGVTQTAAVQQGFEVVATDQPRRFDVAVIGALGAHKGLHLLDEVTACLPADVRLVVIGYVDGQTEPGWRIPDRLWVHGAFEPSELNSLIARSGVRMAFFPNRVPESFCYALSDAWLAGLPALVPNEGALGERMAEYQAGWTYPHNEPAPLLAARILAALGEAEALGDLVKSTGLLQVSEDQMVSELEEIYAIHGSPMPEREPLAAVARLAQTHLDGAFFRQELIRLTSERSQLLAQQAQLQAELGQLAKAEDQRVAWIERQQTDIEALQREVSRVEAARAAEIQELQGLVAVLRRETENLNHGNAVLTQQLHRLQHEHTESEALLSALLLPLRVLPASFRDRLIRSAKWRLARRKKND